VTTSAWFRICSPPTFELHTSTCRYEPIKRLGRGTFGLVLQAKFREYPEPHPCLLGAKADLSAGIRGHTIPDVVDLVSDSETGEESMGDGRSSVDKFTKVDNLMLAIDASLHLDKDWWKVLADAIPAEQCEAQVKGMIEKFATEAVKREEEERLHPSMAEAKRELEVLKYEYEMERESLPPLGTTVAVKKMYRDPKSGDSFSREALRELKLLVEASHPHIVRIYEVFLEKQAIHMSMEILKSNLDKVIRDTSILLSAGDVKQYMRMTLLALNYLHSVGMCHRDLKPENLLIGDDGVLKLADFGGAKLCGTPEMMSPQACTLWYRAPELLMGCRSYGTASDIWSAGCIFGELFRRSALFQGTTDLEQLALIVSVCGTLRFVLTALVTTHSFWLRDNLLLTIAV